MICSALLNHELTSEKREKNVIRHLSKIARCRYGNLADHRDQFKGVRLVSVEFFAAKP